ncbi:MAG: transcriptional repressor [bacterium]
MDAPDDSRPRPRRSGPSPAAHRWPPRDARAPAGPGAARPCGRAPPHADVVDALEGEGMDRTSVFRNLRDLAAAGLLHRFDPGDHVWRYEVRTTGHPHIICRDCGTIRCAAGVSVAIQGADPALMARGLEVQLQGLATTAPERVPVRFSL